MTERKTRKQGTMKTWRVDRGRVEPMTTTMTTTAIVAVVVVVAVVESLVGSFLVLQGRIRSPPNRLLPPRAQSQPRVTERATVAKEGPILGFGVAGERSTQTLQSKSCTP